MSARTMKVLLVLLVLGVWGLLFHVQFPVSPAYAQSPSSTEGNGHYQLALLTDGSVAVLDTQTGEIRGFSRGPFSATWANNYKELTVAKPAKKAVK